jgi:hypothetical protein
MTMNGSFELQVDIGIGPQLVIMGTILGSIFIGAITISITDKINWGEISSIAYSMQDKGQSASNEETQQIILSLVNRSKMRHSRTKQKHGDVGGLPDKRSIPG